MNAYFMYHNLGIRSKQECNRKGYQGGKNILPIRKQKKYM